MEKKIEEIEEYLKSMNFEFVEDSEDQEENWHLVVSGKHAKLDYCVYLLSNSFIVYDLETLEDIFLRECASRNELFEIIKNPPSFNQYAITPKADSENVWVSEFDNIADYEALFLINHIDTVESTHLKAN